ncbi:hypothetical protein LguiB_029324 [Lonicera macranthoides]
MLMASQDIGLVQTPSAGLNPNLLFQDDTTSLRFRSAGDPAGPKTTRELTGFIDDHRFFQPEFRRSMYAPDRPERRDWNGNGRMERTPSGDGSDGDDDDEDEEDEEEDEEEEVDGLVAVDDSSNKNNSSNTSGHSSGGGDNEKLKHLSSFGSSRGVMKEGNILPSINVNNSMRTSSSENHHQQGRVSQYQSAVTIADPDGELYYSQYLQGPEGSAAGQKDMVENGCGFSGRKDVSYSSESGESLRAILSDPLTGALMDDAMILPCGHSFGGGGIQHVIRMKACYTCSQPASEDLVAPNLSLRAAVQAFRREEELQVHRASKRRKERFEQDNKGNHGDSTLMDPPRGRGVQFPFAVTDRVIIKGNKRTPQRFVGREAVVTTQCLNGWYVVKTLDNAESVKLQYRSLAKVPDNNPSSKPTSSKMTPNWL